MNQTSHMFLYFRTTQITCTNTPVISWDKVVSSSESQRRAFSLSLCLQGNGTFSLHSGHHDIPVCSTCCRLATYCLLAAVYHEQELLVLSKAWIHQTLSHRCRSARSQPNLSSTVHLLLFSHHVCRTDGVHDGFDNRSSVYGQLLVFYFPHILEYN